MIFLNLSRQFFQFVCNLFAIFSLFSMQVNLLSVNFTSSVIRFYNVCNFSWIRLNVNLLNDSKSQFFNISLYILLIL